MHFYQQKIQHILQPILKLFVDRNAEIVFLHHVFLEKTTPAPIALPFFPIQTFLKISSPPSQPPNGCQHISSPK